ncbi:MAG: AMP-binding protein [Candidatus Acidiferrales bacterium]
MPRKSLAEFVAELSLRGPQTAYSEAFGYRRNLWTYFQLAETASQFARELEESGVGPGDRVLIWGPNSAEWVAAFFGCLLRGAAAVPIDHGASPEFAGKVAAQVQARFAVISRERVLPGPVLPTCILESLSERIGHHFSGPYNSPPLDREAVAEILFTSGTTADPKGVVISHGNILANLEPLEAQIQPYLKYERFFHPIRFLNAVPLSHVFGQFMGMFVPPLLGGVVVFGESLNPAEVFRLIRKERVSVLVAVPRVLESLQSKLERDLEAEGRMKKFRRTYAAAEGKRFWRRMWRFRRIHRRFGWKFWAVISGGAALRPETEAFWSRLGFAVIQGYGLTETTSLVSVNHPFRIGRGSIGKVLNGREVRLSEDGEILVRGAGVAAGYWDSGGRRPLGEEDQGWYRTGDVGELDADGNLYFRGRKKDVIVTPAGMNVYPTDLESALRRQAEVRDSVVFGLEAGGNTEACAVLLLRDPGADVPGVLARTNQSLAEYQRLRRWWVWPEADFPRTATGKPRAGVIRETAEAALKNRTIQTVGAPSGDRLGELIRKVRSGAGSISPTADLETELGLSSLDRVELLGAIEDRFQVDLDETRFTKARTVAEIEQLLGKAERREPSFDFPRWPQHWPVTWIRAAIYYLLVYPATHIMAHPRVFGREKLKGVRGPVLVVSNHQLEYDVGFLMAAMPARLRYHLATAMGGERLALQRRPPREWFFLKRWAYQLSYFLLFALFNVFPLPKQAGFRESFRFTGSLVDRGYSILIFPEGEITPDGAIHEFRAGIGLLVNNLRLLVLPMRIEGAHEIHEAGTRFNRPGRVRVYVGAPVEFTAASDPQQIARMLEDRVKALGSGER